ncbi:peptidoglycan-binding protein [Mesorhizobium sp. BAC0120]|uniref:glycoside hydrolase family protein n=1 Tax=Mesorhizobium sp. BAC0120 TaxID=3090670 RepID=UPI00298CBC53|nr:peptidoglycan-binding protein [Mesorhizobium sp. BAC0120]MDW6020227.1 peptidoglycan-binding protein [Mesorhizobium sp. BAC0120]
MDLSPNGAAFLRLQEGFVDHWYADVAGVGTIGVGFTWRSTSFRDWWAKNRPGESFGPGAKMTRAEADDALTYLCRAEYGKAVNDFLGHAVPQHVFDGMVSPVYNCGADTLADRWATAAKRGDYHAAAMYLETTRITAKGKRIAGLVRRRREEGLLIEKAVYTGVATSSKPATPDPMADGILIRGERGAAVAALIRDLTALGYYHGTQDDVFGYGTEAAVLAFQRAKFLKDDGYAGRKTLALIADDIAKLKARAPATPTAPPAEPVQRDRPPAPQSAPAQTTLTASGVRCGSLTAIINFLLSFVTRKA